jgi:hypothetical protein
MMMMISDDDDVIYLLTNIIFLSVRILHLFCSKEQFIKSALYTFTTTSREFYNFDAFKGTKLNNNRVIDTISRFKLVDLNHHQQDAQNTRSNQQLRASKYQLIDGNIKQFDIYSGFTMLPNNLECCPKISSYFFLIRDSNYQQDWEEVRLLYTHLIDNSPIDSQIVILSTNQNTKQCIDYISQYVRQFNFVPIYENKCSSKIMSYDMELLKLFSTASFCSQQKNQKLNRVIPKSPSSTPVVSSSNQILEASQMIDPIRALSHYFHLRSRGAFVDPNRELLSWIEKNTVAATVNSTHNPSQVSYYNNDCNNNNNSNYYNNINNSNNIINYHSNNSSNINFNDKLVLLPPPPTPSQFQQGYDQKHNQQLSSVNSNNNHHHNHNHNHNHIVKYFKTISTTPVAYMTSHLGVIEVGEVIKNLQNYSRCKKFYTLEEFIQTKNTSANMIFLMLCNQRAEIYMQDLQHQNWELFKDFQGNANKVIIILRFSKSNEEFPSKFLGIPVINFFWDGRNGILPDGAYHHNTNSLTLLNNLLI